MAKVKVEMVFAPSEEARFFEALREGRFNAKAVAGALDAMKAEATIEADKAMITDLIQRELTIDSYNDQLRRFLEQVRGLGGNGTRYSHH